MLSTTVTCPAFLNVGKKVLSKTPIGRGVNLALNVGKDDWNFTIKNLAESVKKMIPNVDISFAKDASPDKRSYKVDFSLFKSIHSCPLFCYFLVISLPIFLLRFSSVCVLVDVRCYPSGHCPSVLQHLFV